MFFRAFLLCAVLACAFGLPIEFALKWPAFPSHQTIYVPPFPYTTENPYYTTVRRARHIANVPMLPDAVVDLKWPAFPSHQTIYVPPYRPSTNAPYYTVRRA